MGLSSAGVTAAEVMPATNELSLDSLKPALEAIRVGNKTALGKSLDKLPNLGATKIIKSDWMAGHLLARAVMVQAREQKYSPDKAIALAVLLLKHGASDKSVCAAFGEAFVSYMYGSFEKAIALDLAQWINAEVSTSALEVRAWASQTLGALFKHAAWKKWRAPSIDDELSLDEKTVRLLMNLGANQGSSPPVWHKEQNPAAFYAIELGNPCLTNALFSGIGDKGQPRPRARRKPATHNAATRQDRARIVRALKHARFDPSTGDASENAYGEKRLERLLEVMGARFVPKLGPLDAADADRTRSMIGGLPFTSAKFPWPGPGDAPHAPLLQLDLAEISTLAGMELGGGLLQVWRSLEQGINTPGPSAIEVRRIPRRSVASKRNLTPPPSVFLDCPNDPSYSWKEGKLGRPQRIDGWVRAGFAVPTLSEFVDAKIPKDIIKLTERVPRPDLGVGLFDCPEVAGPFYDLPERWRPLLTLYGPLHGCDCGEWDAFRDRVEIYFATGRRGGVEFKASWVCGEEGW